MERRRGKQTRYSEPERASYSESQANLLSIAGLAYTDQGAQQSPPGPRDESRIEAAGVASGPLHQSKKPRT